MSPVVSRSPIPERRLTCYCTAGVVQCFSFIRPPLASLPGDISSKDGLKKLVEEFGAKESGLDILINGAGVLGNKLSLDPSKKDDSEFGKA